MSKIIVSFKFILNEFQHTEEGESFLLLRKELASTAFSVTVVWLGPVQ